MVIRVVTKGQFWVVITEVGKRQLCVVITVVKKGCFEWVLVWLKWAVLGGY